MNRTLVLGLMLALGVTCTTGSTTRAEDGQGAEPIDRAFSGRPPPPPSGHVQALENQIATFRREIDNLERDKNSCYQKLNNCRHELADVRNRPEASRAARDQDEQIERLHRELDRARDKRIRDLDRVLRTLLRDGRDFEDYLKQEDNFVMRAERDYPTRFDARIEAKLRKIQELVRR